MQYCILKIEIMATLLLALAILVNAGPAAAGSVEVLTFQDGATTRTVDVVRGDSQNAARQNWAFESPTEQRYRILPGGGDTLQVFDTRLQRIGNCFKANTFNTGSNRGSDSMTIRCRWWRPRAHERARIAGAVR